MTSDPIRYNVHKVSEGGIGQREALRIAKEAGATKVWPDTSIYVGQTAVLVQADKRTHRRIERELYG